MSGRRNALRWALFVLALLAVWQVGVSFKAHHFARSGFQAGHSFWMESAQRFRYVETVSRGAPLPDPDVRMQSPAGYDPWSDTVLQEQLYGRLHAWLAPDLDLAVFVRALTALVSSTGIFAVALLVLALTRRRSAALLSALLYAVALPIAARGIGTTIFREDLAFPVLCLHLAALAWWTRSARIAAALTAGLLLALSLLLWKVLTFYFVLLVGFVATAHWLQREQVARLLPASLALFLPSALAALLPLSLRHDSFLTSTAFLLALAVIVTLVIERFVQGPAQARAALLLSRPVVFAAVFSLLRWALPPERGYAHAWETIAAKLRFLGEKPLDPGELSFHARHYWTGNYESPSLHALLESWPWLVLAALPGLWVLVLAWRGLPRRGVDLEGTEAAAAGVDAELAVSGRFVIPLPPIAAHFGLWMVLTFGASFFAFRKLQLFFGLALVVLAGLGYAGLARRHRGVRLGFVLAAALVLFQTPGLDTRWCSDPAGSCGQSLRFAREVADVAGPAPRGEWRHVDVFPSQAFDGLARTLPELVSTDEPVLASFVVSPFLLAHLDLSTVLHCFFEGDLLERLEEVTLARFGSEEELWQVARRYGATWYLHEPHHLLRTDRRMSQRYVADRLDWPGDSVLARMQYAPEELQHFELVWENDWFRLFRVAGVGEQVEHPPVGSTSPIWSRALFESLLWDPLESAPETAESSPEDLLYSTLWAERNLVIAKALQGGSPEQREQARAYVMQALLTAPYLVAGEEALAVLKEEEGDGEGAALHRSRAMFLRAALAGDIPLPAPLRPRPLLMDDGR